MVSENINRLLIAFGNAGLEMVKAYKPNNADNLHAAMKHLLDGVCTALDINDRQFRQVQLGFGEVHSGENADVVFEWTPEVQK